MAFRTCHIPALDPEQQTKVLPAILVDLNNTLDEEDVRVFKELVTERAQTIPDRVVTEVLVHTCNVLRSYGLIPH